VSKIQSLLLQRHPMADVSAQRQIIETGETLSFDAKLREANLLPLRTANLEVLQINVGRVCNQACGHCHVDAAPDRKESMPREVFEECLRLIEASSVPVIDITGGAPEMNPNFRWFVESVSRLKRRIMVRCNLTIIVSHPRFGDLPSFYAKHGVEVISSLPFYSAARTDAQRGAGVFEASIAALKQLNEAGYGREDSGLILNLVYNPSGAFLPADQAGLEAQFKRELKSGHGIEFNELFSITNMPISRFLEYLLRTENYESYMERLVDAFNPAAAAGVMCRNTLSVGWDGRLFDCDFNQMLDLGANNLAHIRTFHASQFADREIVTGRHCFGCTAGSGSSCGGSTA
jgi:radical SAM/Cys-rich protein